MTTSAGGFLLDTNVLSEIRHRKAHSAVLNWFSKQSVESLFISVLTLGEIRKGLEKAADTQYQALLKKWIDVEVPSYFMGRLLNIDTPVAHRWGCLLASVKRSLPPVDSLLAATALHHGLVMVTRNVRDFENLGLEIINPWVDAA